MSVAIQSLIQTGVALDRVTFSRDHRTGPLVLDLLTDALTVIALVSHNRLARGQLGYQTRGFGTVIDVASRKLESDRQSISIDSQMSLARVASAAFANASG